MDLQIPMIFVGIFLAGSGLLVLVYKFSIREKSYEEALAEQRQQSHVLLGTKAKPKEKKSKKATKKGKEGKEKSPAEATPEEDAADSSAASGKSQPPQEVPQKKPHVEFKEAVEEVPTLKVSAAPVQNKKSSKKTKVQPILLNKESAKDNVIDTSVDPNVSPVEMNHFEELHPKDDCELKRSNSSEELIKGKSAKSKPEADSNPSKVSKQSSSKVAAAAAVTKEKEKEKEEKPVEVPASGSSVTNGFVANVGKEKKKKKSEFNALQQLTADKNGITISAILNLVRKAELSRSDVQILIDLLLNKQHEAPAVMDEWSEGKSDPVQKLKKQLSEKEHLLAEEQQAVVSAQTRLKEVRAEQQAERAQLQQKIRALDEVLQAKQAELVMLHQQSQQLQAQLNEEVMTGHKLREDLGAMQMQRQQIDIRLAQAQETEVVIGQLQGEVQELSAINQQLRMELARLSEEEAAEKERHQALVVQLNAFQKEIDQKSELIVQLEEGHLDLERNMEAALRQENEFQMEISRLKSAFQQQTEEVRRLEHGKKQQQDEIFQLQREKEESEGIIEQYKVDLEELQEEKTVQNNGSLEEHKAQEVELLNLHNELASIRTQLEQKEHSFELDMKVQSKTVADLERQLEEQRAKNDALRTRNWKVMEALNAAESRIKSDKSADKIKSDQEAQRQFIQRLFPEIKELATIAPESFEVESERHIRKFLDSVKEAGAKGDEEEVQQLKSQINHYKDVIDNTEKMLNNLQNHIEQEEINWRVQLSAKTAELEAIKENYLEELKTKQDELDRVVQEERQEKEKALEECEKLRVIHNESISKLDKLRELQQDSTNGPA